MAKTYGTVTTFTAGSVLTAAQLNVAGTSVNNLVVPPSCWVYRTATDVATTGTWFRPAFDAEAYDTDSMHDLSTNTQRITFNTAGIYVVTAACFFNNASSTGGRHLMISKNASNADPTSATAGIAVANVYTTSQANTRANISTTHRFAVGDYITTHIYQDQGSSCIIGDAVTVSGGVTTGPTGNATPYHMSATWIGSAS